MKRTNELSPVKNDLNRLICELSENELLDLHAMSCIRGGDGEGNGGEPIIIIPPKEV